MGWVGSMEVVGQGDRSGTGQSASFIGAATMGPRIRWRKHSFLQWLTVILLLPSAVILSLSAIPSLLGMTTLVVQGGSMGVTCPNGSLVIAETVKATEVTLGDIIVLRRSGPEGAPLWVIHRAVSVRRADGQVFVHTKGDANKAVDPQEYAVPSNVERADMTLPYLGLLVGFGVSGLGRALLFLCPAVAFTVLVLQDMRTSGYPRFGHERGQRGRSMS
jgi:signal peptidase I